PVEESDAEDPEEKDAAPDRGAAAALETDESHEREDPPLAAVVEPQDPGVVLHADDQKERPEDQRQDPEDVLRLEGHRVPARKTDPQRVERARADVSVDDSQRGDGQQEKLAPARGDRISEGRAFEGRRSLGRPVHSSICAPTSTTRFGGSRKKIGAP